MGEKRRQQVTGLTKEERVERAEKSQAFYRLKMIKRWANRSKAGKANNSRTGQRRAWEW